MQTPSEGGPAQIQQSLVETVTAKTKEETPSKP
jgi:hypothetical protein